MDWSSYMYKAESTKSFIYDPKLVGWLVVLRINVDLAIFQPYLDLEAGDIQSLKFKWRGREFNPILLLRKPRA